MDVGLCNHGDFTYFSDIPRFYSSEIVKITQHKAVAIDYCRIIRAVLPLKTTAGNQIPESISIVYG